MMKRHLIAVIIAICTCFAALCGCSAVRGLEKDLQVVLEVNGEYQGCYTVNQFNNAVVPVPEAPHGLMFYGWTADPDWEQKGAENVKISANKGLIRYDDVKDCVVSDERSVTLYPVFAEIPRHDIAIAWYNKVATSGLDEGVIEGFKTELYAYLTSQGFDTSTMDIVIRPYAGNVGPTCDAIKNDGDIDIMIGWAAKSNLEGTGGLKPGVDFLENNGNINISGNKARYAARLSETETCKLVYAWILEKYAGEGGPTLDYIVSAEPVEPVEPVDPVIPPETAITETKLVLGWYSKSGTSGLNTSIMLNFKKALYEYLKSDEAKNRSLDISKLDIIIRPYNGVVADVQSAVTADNDVDIMLGMKAFSLDGITFDTSNSINDYTMGIKTDRRIHLLTNSGLAKFVFDWLSTDSAKGSFATATVAPENKLVIGWYAKTGTSGLDETLINKFKTQLEEYLTLHGFAVADMEIVFRPYDGVVADVQSAVTADNDVDLMLGMKAFALNGVTFDTSNTQNEVAMGIKTDRRIHLISDSGLANFVFEWLKSTDARNAFLAA